VRPPAASLREPLPLRRTAGERLLSFYVVRMTGAPGCDQAGGRSSSRDWFVGELRSPEATHVGAGLVRRAAAARARRLRPSTAATRLAAGGRESAEPRLCRSHGGATD